MSTYDRRPEAWKTREVLAGGVPQRKQASGNGDELQEARASVYRISQELARMEHLIQSTDHEMKTMTGHNPGMEAYLKGAIGHLDELEASLGQSLRLYGPERP